MRFFTSRLGLHALVLGLVVLLPLSSHAQKDTKDTSALDLLNHARKLYEELDYERALKVLSRARQLKRDQEADITLWMYQGMILFDAGKHDESAKAFRQALAQRCGVTLPLTRVSPKMMQFFESLREECTARTAAPFPITQQVIEAPRVGSTKPTEEGVAVRWVERQDPGRSRFAPPVLISATAGGALLAAGGVFFGLSKSESARLRADDPRLATREDVRLSAARGETYQTLGLGLVGAGLVGLGVAAGLHVLRGPEAPDASMSLTVSTDGTSAFVQGKWQ